MKPKFLIGIDEAGRGPLAGPGGGGCVKCGSGFDMKLLKGIRDSKVLSEVKRDEWFEKLQAWKKAGLLDYSVALISASVIDKKGITFAIRSGIQKCLKKVK